MVQHVHRIYGLATELGNPSLSILLSATPRQKHSLAGKIMNHSAAANKISKACEPCRRRKIRCNGLQPCNACHSQPGQCAYRVKARSRKSAAQTAAKPATPANTPKAAQEVPPTAELAPHAEQDETAQDTPNPSVYHGITATHTHGAEPVECPQLFYGPSSNFAFLQQLHRSILHFGAVRQPELREDHEGSEGLDMFVQRSIFFGTPRRVTASHPITNVPLSEVVDLPQALSFLSEFLSVSLHLLPMFTRPELEDLLQSFYSGTGNPHLRPQQKALLCAVLAIGALSTDHTDQAELLYEQAKITALAFDEAVTLSMIQLSILFGDYQINIGRPNSAYLHLGVAVRKAFAMGLNREAIGKDPSDHSLQKRRSTMWCLYFHERCVSCPAFGYAALTYYRWHALAMGRPGALKMQDITTEFPANEPVLIALCEVARVAEANAEVMYLQKSESLRVLYLMAEKAHDQLRRVMEQADTASSPNGRHSEIASLHLRNSNFIQLRLCNLDANFTC